MKRQNLWMFLVAIAALGGCDGSGGNGLPYEEDAYPPDSNDVLGDVPGSQCLSQNVWAQPTFDWLMTSGVELDVLVVHLDGEPWPDVVVSVFDDSSELPGDQVLLAKGVTDENGKWVGSAVMTLDQDAVNIVVNIVGAKNWDRVLVTDGRVTVEFGRGE
jgi:hypothetical protein